MGSNDSIDKQHQGAISLFDDSAHPRMLFTVIDDSDHFEFN